ncbi:MAG: xanthine dehydrogenase family protein subunit M [Candidatus Tectomicrobia bacterium]|uniref:Xanthine dehydrogenase family protein subunit M n=1 Tax=Tectimicrobiota bacterium TaxID=2528274 RepID=A0A932GS18_UNCTE|nr:xanthine dehydrogenase family protein subunit M [Candidatus Tectomicrobia bacterium]
MKSFAYVPATSTKSAVALLGRARGKARVMAGGTDLLGEMKDNLISPEQIVGLKPAADLNYVKAEASGLRIGALTPLSELAEHKVVRERYPILVQAVEQIATPQLRNMGTVGGNLCQRPRCWYYRGASFPCLKKGGEICYAVNGENLYNAILEGGPCYIVHPSDLASPLQALGAKVKMAGPKGERTVPLEKFFVLPRVNAKKENILGQEEILTEIQVPAVPATMRGTYVKFKERGSWDFGLVSAAALLDIRDGICREARIVLGAVAPVPYRAARAEEVLKGKRVDERLAAQVAEVAVMAARPMSQNAYKVRLAQAAVKRTVLSLA